MIHPPQWTVLVMSIPFEKVTEMMYAECFWAYRTSLCEECVKFPLLVLEDEEIVLYFLFSGRWSEELKNWLIKKMCCCMHMWWRSYRYLYKLTAEKEGWAPVRFWLFWKLLGFCFRFSCSPWFLWEHPWGGFHAELARRLLLCHLAVELHVILMLVTMDKFFHSARWLGKIQLNIVCSHAWEFRKPLSLSFRRSSSQGMRTDK